MPTIPDRHDNGVLITRSGGTASAESFTQPAVSESGGWTGFYAEWSGVDHYTVHMTKEAVDGLSELSGYLFSALSKALSAASEYLAPLVDAIAAYFQAEWEVIKAVSARSSDGRVKASGYAPALPTNIQTDAGFNPPGGYTWNPPPATSGIKFPTVNSMNFFNGNWCFTASNFGSGSSKSVYCSVSGDDHNRFVVDPRDFRGANGFPALQGHPEFDFGLDTCVYSRTTNTWLVFKGQHVAQTNVSGTQLIGGIGNLMDFPALKRISDGEFGQAEKDAWANGITTAAMTSGGLYYLCAGRRIVILLADRNFYPIIGHPRDIGSIWPSLSKNDLSQVMQSDFTPKALWMGSLKGWGNDVFISIFENKTITNTGPDDGWFTCWISCPPEPAFTSWSALAAYTVYSPGTWPYTRCPAEQSV